MPVQPWLCPDQELDPAGHPRRAHRVGQLDRLVVRNQSGSLVPWKVSTGASSLETNVKGDAWAAAAGLSVGVPPRKSLTQGLQISGMSLAARSLGPK